MTDMTATAEEETDTEEERELFDRSRILSHIDRYNLSGEIESVEWNFEDGRFSTGFVSQDNTIIGEVEVEDMPFDESAKLGIMQTSNLKKLIKILEDEFDMEIEHAGDQARVMTLDDNFKTIDFRLSNLSVIPNTPNLKRLPDFQVQIDITDEFADDFRSAESALDEDEFAVRTTPDGVKVVVGYTADSRREHNNKVTIPVQTGDYEQFSDNNITFKSGLFAEILKANSDAETGTWEVSEEGLSRIQFDGEDWSAMYYFVSQQEV
jgi:hypothetical protein